MSDVEDRIDKVGAMSAAIANLRTMGFDPEAPTEIAIGVGQYKSETGLALGVFHYPNQDFMLSASISTSGDEVMGGIGGFSGAFSLSAIKDMEDPVLLSGTDGVGTKLKLAFLMDKHDTIGIDAVAMCVNDIACAGAEPLFFLDYIACGKNYPEKIAEIVKGVAEGCVQSEAALIGGETAEHPGLMPEDEYDLAGFAVGVVDKKIFLQERH